MGTSVVDSLEGPLNIEQGDPLAIDFKALATARFNICRLGDLNEGCHSHSSQHSAALLVRAPFTAANSRPFRGQAGVLTHLLQTRLPCAENRVFQFGEGLFLTVPWMNHYTLNELPHPQVDFT